MMPIRVLVVDDSVVVRRIVSDVLSADPRIDVVGWAANGRLAQAKVEQLRAVGIDVDPQAAAVARLAATGGARSAVVSCATASSSCSRGTTTLASPIACASAAPTGRPVRQISIARE